MINLPAVLAGAAVGLGVAVMAAGWRRPEPDLHAALARIQDTYPRPRPAPTADAGDTGTPTETGNARDPSSVVERLARRLAARLTTIRAQHNPRTTSGSWQAVRLLRLDRLSRDLDLLEETLDLLLVRKAGCALLGLAFPAVLTTGLALLGVHLPWTLPALAALAVGGVLFWVPDIDVRVRAAAARDALRRAVCLYIELVSLERAADAGPIEAVERAADLDAPAFARIRAALLRARLDGAPPWQGLHELAEATGVTELGDLADIMSTSGRQGAAVRASLRARASSLRTALTTEDAAAANAASERMVVPVAMLGLVFMALIAYPAFARILFTHP